MTKNPQSARQNPILRGYALLVFAFLYLPVAVLVLYSFNRDGVGGFPPKHLTFAWYAQLFADGAIWDSVVNSLIVAGGAVATVVDNRFTGRSGAGSGRLPGQSTVSPRRPAASDIARNHHRAFSPDVRRLLRHPAESLDCISGTRYGLDFRRDYRTFCRAAETRSCTGRSLSRPWREFVADVLARHTAESEAFSHRCWVADLHTVDG